MRVEIDGPKDAKIMLVGEAPGRIEDRVGKPFQNVAGSVLTEILTQAGINRHDCLITNVAKERPPNNNFSVFYKDKKQTIPDEQLSQFIEELRIEIETYKPNIVVCLGRHALWALCGQTSIESARGYIHESTLVPGIKVIGTYHPSAINREFKLKFISILDLRKAKRNSLEPDLPPTRPTPITNFSINELCEYLEHHAEKKTPLAFDIETTQPGSHITHLGFASSFEDAVSFNINQNFAPESEFKVWNSLRKVAECCPIIMANGKFDLGALYYNLHILIKNFIFDTMIAGHILFPECPRSLGFLSSICLNTQQWKETSNVNMALYNANDARNTYGIYQVLSVELARTNQYEIFDFEMRQNYPAVFMELSGVKIDKQRQEELKTQVLEKVQSLKSELEEMLGRPIAMNAKEPGLNLRSSKQMQKFLYEELKLPVQYKRRKSKNEARTPTAGTEALKTLQLKTNNPAFLKIMEFKEQQKLLEFIDVKTTDGRVHTSYNITGTNMHNMKGSQIVDEEEGKKSFGRWSSSRSIIISDGSGNLQNIPYAARKMYAAPEDYCIIQMDYSTAEAVVVAFESLDTKLIDMFQKSFGMRKSEKKANHYDLHTMTAAINFDLSYDEVTPEHRSIGKRIRHATNYSAGPKVLSLSLGCSMTKAKEYLELHFRKNPQVKMWHRILVETAKRNSMTLTNLFGRKHKFLGRWNDQLFRSMYAYIPQSTIADLTNKTIVRFYEDHGDMYSIYLQLHDAIYVICPLNKKSIIDCVLKMRECAVNKVQPLVSSHGKEFYIDTDFSIGLYWGEMEELEYADIIAGDFKLPSKNSKLEHEENNEKTG